MGRARAMRLALLSRPLSAQEAHDAGLVSHVFADERLRRAGWARRAPARRRASAGLRRHQAGRQRRHPRTGSRQAFARERAGQSLLLRTDDVAEGMRAFAEKRRPEFHGR